MNTTFKNSNGQYSTDEIEFTAIRFAVIEAIHPTQTIKEVMVYQGSEKYEQWTFSNGVQVVIGSVVFPSAIQKFTIEVRESEGSVWSQISVMGMTAKAIAAIIVTAVNEVAA